MTTYKKSVEEIFQLFGAVAREVAAEFPIIIGDSEEEHPPEQPELQHGVTIEGEFEVLDK